MQHVIESAAQAAWDRYEEASQRAARWLRGDQLSLFDQARAEAAEWLGIATTCDLELSRIPLGDAWSR